MMVVQKQLLTEFFKGEVGAAIPERVLILRVVGRRRRARPAPGHAATEHPPSDHFGAVSHPEPTAAQTHTHNPTPTHLSQPPCEHKHQ